MATATTSAPATKIPYSLLRRYINSYDFDTCFDREPTTVCYYRTWSCYGGPEEGGWYYEYGKAIKTVCVFSKKQAIREAIKLYCEALEETEDGKECDNLGWRNFSVEYAQEYAKDYPTERPYYC